MPKLANLLESKLPAATVEMLRTAGELAALGDAGAGDAYLIGGSVRDLVLGREPSDPDIVVTGNGPRFARALAEKINGTVTSVSQFGTAVIDTPTGPIDIATARSETYSSPASLPDITPSTIEDDLQRRDFSVNAMAISILPGKWGELLDRHRGFSDAARGKIRILHDESFRDDPTRILRAVRYEIRLGFSLAVDTAEALDRDLSYIDRLSSARLLAELQKMLREPMRADILRRAEELGIVGAISPTLRVTVSGLKTMEHFAGPANPDSPASDPVELLFVACLTSSLTEEEAEPLIVRLQPDRDWQAVIRGAAAFRNVVSILELPGLKPSEIVELLARIPGPVIEYQRVAGPKTRQREHIEAFVRRHREVRPEMTGDELIAEGAPPGPILGKLLLELKNARLDGKVFSHNEELDLVRRRLPMLLGRQ
jgi:tRNA nucleotidyltransferase (CCA-adding enzyme)